MIIFLYGEDGFRSRQKLFEIKQKYLEKDKSGSGLSLFDCDEKIQADGMINVFGTPNLLSPKRLVIIKRLIATGSEIDQKKVLEFFKKRKEEVLGDKDLIAVFWEDNQPKKNNSLFKFLENFGKKQNFEKLAGAKLDQWVVRRTKEINPASSISRTALSKLILYSGSDMEALDNEIQKLVNYSEESMISEKDVDTLVNANLDANIFATVDALGANNKKEALLLLHRHLQRGDDPFYVFSMFLYQFRNLLKIADLKERGVSSEYEISKMTKMHPFVIRKSLGQIRNLTFSKLKNIYQKLGDMDVQVKTGKLDIKLALDKFVAEL